MKKAFPCLDKNEWDFSQCDKAELLACWTYEFLREKHRGKASPKLKSFYQAAGNSLSRMVASLEQFPETAWLSIPTPQRKSALHKMTSEALSFKNHLWEGIEEYQESIPDDPHASVITLHLDWRKSDTKLKKEFEAVLFNLRPAKNQSRNTGRAGTIRDKLNALGARRLLRHFGNNAERAIAHVDGEPNRSLYGDARALRRAAKKADGLISGDGSTETYF